MGLEVEEEKEHDNDSINKGTYIVKSCSEPNKTREGVVRFIVRFKLVMQLTQFSSAPSSSQFIICLPFLCAEKRTWLSQVLVPGSRNSFRALATEAFPMRHSLRTQILIKLLCLM